ncbi:MAG: hypothetical protein ACK2UQ_07800, partial [Anaerolineae bacterium]
SQQDVDRFLRHPFYTLSLQTRLVGAGSGARWDGSWYPARSEILSTCLMANGTRGPFLCLSAPRSAGH